MAWQRVTTFPLRPDAKRSELESVADRFGALLSEQPGWRRNCIEVSQDGAVLQSVSVWDSAETAEAATANVRDAATEALASMLSGPPHTVIGEVLFEKSR